MPSRCDETSMNKENKNVISLMRMFKENVKTDITYTNDIIDMVQKKLQDFDLNLNSLKNTTNELNKEFAVIEEKITNLDSSLKRVNSFSSMSRTDSFSSISSVCSNSDFSSTTSEAESETDELENTFVMVVKNENTNNFMMKEENKNENDGLTQMQKEEYKTIDENCNQLIELLIKNAK